MTERTWQIQGKSGIHTVRVEHTFWSGKASVTVDGEVVYHRPRRIFDFGLRTSFSVDGIECSVRALPTPWGEWRYLLYTSIVKEYPANSLDEQSRLLVIPRKIKMALVGLSIALLISLCSLAWTLWQNYWWRSSVDYVADEAGAGSAISTFRNGHLVMWEINPTNDFPRFSGRKDGPFEIWLDEYHAEMPEPWHYTQRRKWETHNRQMRLMYERSLNSPKDAGKTVSEVIPGK